MLTRILIVFLNLWIRIVNLWRRLWRRRVGYVRIELTGILAELADPPPLWQRRLLGTETALSVVGLRRLFRVVADDPQAQGVLLVIDGLNGGWATLQSLRATIAALRSSGKHVVAYLVTPDLASTYVACAAEMILLPPTAHWNVLGLRAEAQFLRDALAKWGITVEATAVSPYKSAPDTFVRSDYSPESRAQLERLLDLRYAELVQALADGRGKTPEEIRALIDTAPLGPQAALAAGLVDGLCYEDQIAARLAQAGVAAKIDDAEEALQAVQRPLRRFYPKQIGLIRVEGTIMRGASRTTPLPLPLIGSSMAGAESFAQAMRQAEANKRMAAVLVYVDSGGGEVFASDLMWREVQRVAKQKPVVVVMGNAAASGGYYLATHASAIVAQPATVTGSIGVFFLRPVLAGLLEHGEVHTTVLSRGTNSGLLGGTLPATEPEQAATRALVADLYADFTERVTAGRKISQEQLAPIAGGRVWLGAEAQTYGLVDTLGGLPEGLQRAQELAGIAIDPTMPLRRISGVGSSLPPAPFPTEQPAALLALAQELLQPGAWALMPFELR